MKAIYLCDNPQGLLNVYAPETRKAISDITGVGEKVFRAADLAAEPERFRDVRYIFSTWGMPSPDEETIARVFPNLEAVFYAAGTVQKFARPFLARGVKVFSAWAANAIPVAEYAVSQILLANKGFFATCAMMSGGNAKGASAYKKNYPGNYGGTVGIIGAGMIGKLVIRMLKNYRLETVTFDPFLPDTTAAELGVRKVGLEELFATCTVVTNHLANNAETRGMLKGKLFASMKPYATFLNTGRGAQVVESELAEVLAKRPDLTAILDVTDPEPPLEGSPFYSLPNCFLTPHIAGSSGDEVHRMAEYMLDECKAFLSGAPCRYEVTEKMLETMA